MRFYDLGNILEGNDSLRSQYDPDFGEMPEKRKRFFLSDDELNTHVLALGTTGSGKSRFLWQLMREHRRNGRGCCVIDPGDLVDDFLADVGRMVLETGAKDLLRKVHLVELSPFQLARYDPFRFSCPTHIHPELRQTVYRSWQHTKVQSFAEIYQWKQGQSTDFEGMPRLQRMFINVLTAVSTQVEQQRLSVADAQVLVDLGHPEHYRVCERLEPHLPREIVADFEVLHSFRSVRDLRQETESFLNRIRSMHGPLLKEMLSGAGEDPVLDLHQIVQRGEFLLVKTGRTPYASNDQNGALASMFIHDIIETVLVTPREKRRPFTLIIDEAHKYARPGIGDIARTARKYQLSLVLATTDLVSLKKGDVDLAPELLSVVNTVMAFRMTWPEDLDKTAAFLYGQNLDFTELVQEVERRAGPEWLQVNEWSETYSRQTGSARTSATSVSNGESSQDASGHVTQQNNTASCDANGSDTGTARGGGNSRSLTSSSGATRSNSVQNGVTDSQSEGFGVTVNHKLVHLEKIVRELQHTGMLKHGVADQLAEYAQRISGQSSRRATVRVRNGKALEIETLEVKDPFVCPEAQAKAVDWIRRELYQVHDYYFTPTLDPAEDERRIREFLSTNQKSGHARRDRSGDHGTASRGRTPAIDEGPTALSRSSLLISGGNVNCEQTSIAAHEDDPMP